MKKVLLSLLVGAFAFSLVGIGIVAAEDIAKPENSPAWGQTNMNRSQFMNNCPGLTDEEIAAREQQRLQHGAEMLGSTVEEFQAKLNSGMKFREMAKEQGISKEDFRAKMKEQAKVRMTDRLNQLIANGEITQEQADNRLEQIQKKLQNGKRLENGHKGFSRGPKSERDAQ